ncbi:hypothetical protein R3P38DRAFT_2811337 [Favolaschia claudopus]|uniref:Ricin B lectin domain-containing protein n=1 Tax=Favolaschia claudopus TaxID=2862362 RepID=A0AAV9Z981_9AGAR
MTTFNGLCCNDDDAVRYSSAIGSKVVAWAPHQPTDGKAYGNQVWEIKPSENGDRRYTIVNAKTGTYLEAIGGVDPHRDNETGETGQGIDGVQVTCSKAGEDTPSYQDWHFLGDPTGEFGEKYAIGNVATRLLLDVEGGSRTNGAKIQIHCAVEDIGNVKELFWLIEPAEYSKPSAQTSVDTMPAGPEANQTDA